MSSDEDDYMSDKFASVTTPDIRPGLQFSQKRKREMEMHSKQAKLDEQNRKKSTPKQRQQDQLEKGLANAIPKTNIGFAMLAKMGYKEGSSLGKSGQEGIVVPIGITVKEGRGGLGREAAVKQFKEKQKQLAREKLLKKADVKDFDPNEFRMRKVRESQLRQVEGDLSRCQRVCRRMDMEMQFEEPTISWFWPEEVVQGEDEEEEEEEPEIDVIQYEPHEKLELINDYLRTTHLYCNWCGVKYDSLEDMTSNCPGVTRDDH